MTTRIIDRLFVNCDSHIANYIVLVNNQPLELDSKW